MNKENGCIQDGSLKIEIPVIMKIWWIMIDNIKINKISIEKIMYVPVPFFPVSNKI